MSLDYSDILRYAVDHPDTEPGAIGLAMTAAMTKAQLREYAVANVCAIVEGYRRRLAREAEDRAEQEAALRQSPAVQAIRDREVARDARAERWERYEQERREWQQLYPDSAIRAAVGPKRGMVGEAKRKEYAEANAIDYVPPASVRCSQERREEYAQEREQKIMARSGYSYEEFTALRDDPATWIDRPLCNAYARQSFRRWAGDGFSAWKASVREAVEASGDESEIAFFKSSWHPDGPDAYYRDKRWEMTRQLILEVAQQTRLQVTAELLSTKFALGDGTMITWGQATIEQHQQRVDMLTTNAAGVVETAARHQVAISMIQDAHVVRLDELAEAQA